jgi:uncharacterized membrane protein
MEILHPKIVHFPIALLLTAAFIAVLSVLIRGKREELKIVLFWNLIIGAVGSVLAVISGLYEKSNLVHNETIHELMLQRERLGYIITGIFIFLALWSYLIKSKVNYKSLFVITLVLIITSVLLGYSSYLGGRMVYQEGAGVKPMEKIIQSQSEEQSHSDHDHSH